MLTMFGEGEERFMVCRHEKAVLVYQVFHFKEGDLGALTLESAAAAHALGIQMLGDVTLVPAAELEECSAFDARRIRAEQRRQFPLYFDEEPGDVVEP